MVEMLQSFVQNDDNGGIPYHSTLVTEWMTPVGPLFCMAIYHPQLELFSQIIEQMRERVLEVVNAKG